MTILNYLHDTYLFTSEGRFLEIRENEKGKAIILDETIFYPQGGGQPADHGKITSQSGVIFLVQDVRLDEDGTVWHFGEFQNGEFQDREKVQLEVDEERRILNAKLHSAGHLLDCAVEQMGITELIPTKGFHFPDGPYVEYEGMLENGNELIPELERIVNELVEKDISIKKEDLSPEEAEKQGVWAPPGKSARVVHFAGFPSCGCGGTHVRSSGEIGKISIRKIKSKKGNTKIAYELEQ